MLLPGTHHPPAIAIASRPSGSAAVLRQVFQSPGWAAVRESEKSKFELKAGPNTYCMEIDREGRVFVVVITGNDGTPHARAFSRLHIRSGADGGVAC